MHVRVVHEPCKDHACPQCKAAFGEASKLRRHVRTVHDQARAAAKALRKPKKGFDPILRQAARSQLARFDAIVKAGISSHQQQQQQQQQGGGGGAGAEEEQARAASCSAQVALLTQLPLFTNGDGEQIKRQERARVFAAVQVLARAEGARRRTTAAAADTEKSVLV
jgi:hypothetical protein